MEFNWVNSENANKFKTWTSALSLITRLNDENDNTSDYQQFNQHNSRWHPIHYDCRHSNDNSQSDWHNSWRHPINLNYDFKENS